MNKTYDHPVALPSWLTTKSRHATPFSRDTQQQLAREAQHDPRVADVVAALQEAIGSDPRSKEWGLVENFCRDASKQLLESHEHFVKANHCNTELNLLRLGAYVSGYSFTNFFQNLHLRITPRTEEQRASGAAPIKHLDEKEKRSYSEAVRVALPIVMELQPKVAVAFAAAIYRTQFWYEQQPVTEQLYEELAAKEPRMVLTRFNMFDSFPNRQKLYDIAQAARANDPVAPLSHSINTPTSLVQADEAQVKFLETHRSEMYKGLSSPVQRR